jgi:hypothetical protein
LHIITDKKTRIYKQTNNAHYVTLIWLTHVVMFHLTPEKEILDLETKIFNSKYWDNANIWYDKNANKNRTLYFENAEKALMDVVLPNQEDVSILTGQGR